MRSFLIAFAALLFLGVPALADKPINTPMGFGASISPGSVSATPEMWFYEQQMRQYADPKVAVRARAEFRANQRQHRVESMKWFGFSNSRPKDNPELIHADFSPGWSSNNSRYPFRWNGTGRTWVGPAPKSSSRTY